MRPTMTAEPSAHGRRSSVLVVEDDAGIRLMLGNLLGELGYATILMATAAEALHVLATVTPAAILLDVGMPVMDGAAFRGEQLRLGLAPGVPVLVMTASPKALGPEWSDLAPAGVLAKPFDADELDAALHAALAGG
jgi:CheY-like chemotaxis protein